MFELSLSAANLDLGYVEGPLFAQNGDTYVVSIDRGVVYRMCGRDTGRLETIRTGGGPNGLVETADRTILVAQNGGAAPATPEPGVSGGVQVIDVDDEVAFLSMHPSMSNDLAIGPDGWVYVTDPKRIPQRTEGRLWKVHPRTGESLLLAVLDWYPNGIGFSSDDSLLFVADTLGSRIVVFDLDAAGISNPRTWAVLPHGPRPDGFAFDDQDNLFVAAVGLDLCPSELQIFDRGGIYLGSADLPRATAHLTNVAISPDGTVMATDATHGDLLIGAWDHAGLPLHPFR